MDAQADTSPEPAAVPVAAVDGRGTVSLWSPLAQRLLGHGPDEIVGRPASALLAEPLPVSALKALAATAPWEGLLATRHRNGGTVSVPVRACPCPDGDGGVDWLVLTAPREGPEPAPDAPGTALALNEWAFLQSPIATSVYDRDLRLAGLNDEMLLLTGQPEARMLGRRLADIHPGAPYEELGMLMARALRTGETIRTDMYFRAPGESRERAWATFLTPFRDPGGRVQGVSLSAVDHTEEHRARQRLALVNDAGARIGTSLDMTRTAEELAEVTAGPFADFVAVDLLDSLLQGDGRQAPPARGPGALRRVAARSADGSAHGSGPATARRCPPGSPPALALASGRPSLHRGDD
ncbi:PAS domain-containing protein, partial [Streptomyces sp. UNOC14_S4]|uniref:PAS domain-containing protein n=1 Tax=Streptomyces sp. UNOC14_S4 TaxID=2872340 RepID=UPI001E4842CD